METAKEFWKNADMEKLADIWHYHEKTPHEYEKLMPLIADSKFIWDAACGDNRVVRYIEERHPDKFYFLCTDIAEWDLSDGLNPAADLSDTVLLLGVLKYLDDASLLNLLKALKGKKIIAREPCGTKTHVKNYSKTLGARYESYNRSLDDLIELMSWNHNIKNHGTIYPPHLESEHGDIQYLFVGTPC